MPFKFNSLTGTLDLVNSDTTGTPNKFASFDSLGNLVSLNNWTVNSLAGSDVSQVYGLGDSGVGTSIIFDNHSKTVIPSSPITTDYIYGDLNITSIEGTNDINSITNKEIFLQHNSTADILSELINIFVRVSLGNGGGSTTSTNSTALKANLRVSGGHTASNVKGLVSDTTMDGGTTVENLNAYYGTAYVGGIANYASGIEQYTQVDGTINNNVNGIFNRVDLNGTTPAVTGLYTGVNGDVTGSHQGIRLDYIGDITGDSVDFSIYHDGSTSNNYTGIDYTKNGSSFRLNIVNANLGSGSNVSDNLNLFSYANQSTVGGTIWGLNMSQTGTVAGDLQVVNLYVDASIGSGTNNLNLVNAFIDSASVNSSITGVNLVNTAQFNGSTNNNLSGLTLSNSGLGYRMQGANIQNTANMDEEFVGVRIGNTGSARTKTLLDLATSGGTTDDVTGLRINMSSETSTNQRPQSINTNGGTVNITSAYNPSAFNGPVDIGNGISVTATVPSGSPLTGVDSFLTFIQSNLIADDNIATGPFGLDTNMVGIVSQVGVASGKTIPLLRSMILGTSVPVGSGGTISEHVVLEMLGLPSFGGSVTNPVRIGIQDSQLLGQNFSDGATDVWGIRWRDANSENYLPRLAIGTTNYKVTNSSVGLELDSTTKAFLPSRMTTTQRDALTALAGMLIFNTDLLSMQYYNGTTWVTF